MNTKIYREEEQKYVPILGMQRTVRLLKGLGNIVQIRDSGAKVMTSMLDVQLKTI